jgi:hypothetical protein
MAVMNRRDELVWRMSESDLKDYLRRRFGADKATRLYSYHQLHRLHGAAGMQRLLGPERYVEALVLLREVGLEV